MTWKRAKGVMLRKPNKLDYTIVKSYRVIRLLNSLGKLCEKVVSDLLTVLCEIKLVLNR